MSQTPLIVCPARQMSQGRPCKNRSGWSALMSCLEDVGYGAVLVTDDPCLAREAETTGRMDTFWLPMDGQHTVARAVALVSAHYSTLQSALGGMTAGAPVAVLQLSSPTTNRSQYLRLAMQTLVKQPDATSVVSVVPWEGEPPSKACTLTSDGYLSIPASPEPRQLQPQHYRRDGTVYAVRRQYAEQGDLYGPRPIPLLIDPKDSVTLD